MEGAPPSPAQNQTCGIPAPASLCHVIAKGEDVAIDAKRGGLHPSKLPLFVARIHLDRRLSSAAQSSKQIEVKIPKPTLKHLFLVPTESGNGG